MRSLRIPIAIFLHTPTVLTLLICLLAIHGKPCAGACRDQQHSPWETIILNGESSKAIPGDFDGDGREEVITGSRWFRPATKEHGTVKGDLINGGVGARAVDIDGDGAMELVGGIGKGQDETGARPWELYWSKPVNGMSEPWETHFIHAGHLGQPHDIVPYDMDGDGIPELIVVGMYFEPPGIYIYKSGPDPKDEWRRYIVSQGKYCDGTALGDFDGDGKMDISSGPYLYLNRSEDLFSGPWQEIHLAPDFRGYCVAAALDITGNGRDDIIIAESEYVDCRISWFENRMAVDPDTPWLEHPLDRGYVFLHSISAWKAKDGVANLFFAEMEAGGWSQPYNLDARLVIFTSADRGKNWDREVISKGLGTWQGVVHDLDGDGQMEVVGRNRFNSTYLWQKNAKKHLTVSYSHRFLDMEKPWPSTDVLSSDVDGDGTEDVVCGAFWYRNGDWKRMQIPDLYQVLCADDIDGDGRDEYVGVKMKQEKKNLAGDRVNFQQALDDTCYWLDPVDPAKQQWKWHVIGANPEISGGAHLPAAVILPVDRAGRKALVTHIDGTFIIYRLPSKPNVSPWIPQILAGAQDCSPKLVAGDLNNDGLMDLAGRWKWLENRENGTFQAHDIVARSEDTSGLKDGDHALADVDGDGLLDLIACEVAYTKSIREPVECVGWLYENFVVRAIDDVGDVWGRVMWFKNPGGAGGRWAAHTINYLRSPGSVGAVDLDGDGAVEIVCGEYGTRPERSRSRLIIFKKFDEKGMLWTRHLIDDRFMHCNGTKPIDLGDGKIGLISHAPGEKKWVHLFEPVMRKEDPGEWVPLFDGKTLEGWIQKNGTATYRVEDGAIVGRTAKGSPNSFLCSVNEYGDFELQFEVMLYDNELNSGVQIRSQTRAAEEGEVYGRVNGPQVEIEASGEKGAEAGYIYCEACGGWMTPEEDLKPHKVFKDNEWNQYRIVAKGARIQTFINGKPVEDLIDEEKFKSHPKGFIGLQVHGVGNRGPFQVAWRNIKLKVMDQ